MTAQDTSILYDGTQAQGGCAGQCSDTRIHDSAQAQGYTEQCSCTIFFTEQCPGHRICRTVPRHKGIQDIASAHIFTGYQCSDMRINGRLLRHKIMDSIVRDGHGGGGSRKINAWHIYTLMVYL
jgi:hypothetical protein